MSFLPRRIIGYARRHPEVLKWIAFPFAAAAIIALGVSTGWVADLTTIVTLVLIFPFVLLFMLQLAFWSYHWLRDGDPLFEPAIHRHTTKTIVIREPKKQAKFCPICKRNSGCHVKKAAMGFWVHVQKK